MKDTRQVCWHRRAAAASSPTRSCQPGTNPVACHYINSYVNRSPKLARIGDLPENLPGIWDQLGGFAVGVGGVGTCQEGHDGKEHHDRAQEQPIERDPLRLLFP